MNRTNRTSMGLYARSWFGVPTSSSQYLRASQANLAPYPRGAGTIFFPGPPDGAGIGGLGRVTLGQDATAPVDTGGDLTFWILLAAGAYLLLGPGSGEFEPEEREMTPAERRKYAKILSGGSGRKRRRRS